MSAGLAASTVTPGITAPDVSLTTPAIALCAEAIAGSNVKTNNPRTTRHRLPGLCMVAPCNETSAAPTRYESGEIYGPEIDAVKAKPRCSMIGMATPCGDIRRFGAHTARCRLRK